VYEYLSEEVMLKIFTTSQNIYLTQRAKPFVLQEGVLYIFDLMADALSRLLNKTKYLIKYPTILSAFKKTLFEFIPNEWTCHYKQ